MFGKTNKNTSTRTGGASVDGTNTTRPNKSHTLMQHLLRALQLLSALTSLILFSVRLAKIIRLGSRASHSNGAVEGILAAAVLYTLIVMALTCGMRAGGGSNLLRILFIIFDILFAGAFIAIAVLTSPKRHGSSSPCTGSARVNGHIPGTVNCNLPWGTFILAIVSTLLHAITAAFHGAKDHRRTKRDNRVVEKDAHHNGHNGRDDGFVDRDAGGGYNGNDNGNRQMNV